jgi:hypothetical protein
MKSSRPPDIARQYLTPDTAGAAKSRRLAATWCCAL